jgi:hypothetical protein
MSLVKMSLDKMACCRLFFIKLLQIPIGRRVAASSRV